MEINLNDIKNARKRIEGRLKRTPLFPSETLSRELGTNVLVKYELFQKTGAFKPRGAFNKLLATEPERLRSGVVAVSGGNHAQAVAYAARELDVDALILMPDNTPDNYVSATKGYGAKVELCSSIAGAFETAEKYEKAGKVFVHPFDDPLVMAGQGTAGLEIVEDCPEVTDLFVSIGGGGLMTGVATAVKSLRPEVRIWGVETDGADAMAKALDAGTPVTLPAITSIAKTLGAPAVSESTLEAAQKYLEKVWVVTDDEAIDAVVFLLERLKVLTEPAAAVTLAAARHAKQSFSKDSNVVLLLCGGNFSVADLCKYRRN